jgi:hypothetical protein
MYQLINLPACFVRQSAPGNEALIGLHFAALSLPDPGFVPEVPVLDWKKVVLSPSYVDSGAE